MSDDTNTKPKKRKYRRITPLVASRFNAEKALLGNGTAAVELLEPGYSNPGDRAWQIQKITGSLSPDEYLDKTIEQIAVRAIDRIEGIVNSADEHVALKASQFVIEQRRGKAVQKTESRSVTLNIQSVLE